MWKLFASQHGDAGHSNGSEYASHAEPDDPTAQALVIEVYRQRITDPGTNTQEKLAYLDAMVAAREAQLAGADR